MDHYFLSELVLGLIYSSLFKYQVHLVLIHSGLNRLFWSLKFNPFLILVLKKTASLCVWPCVLLMHSTVRMCCLKTLYTDRQCACAGVLSWKLYIQLLMWSFSVFKEGFSKNISRDSCLHVCLYVMHTQVHMCICNAIYVASVSDFKVIMIW